jgi:hypothetical protein
VAPLLTDTDREATGSAPAPWTDLLKITKPTTWLATLGPLLARARPRAIQ